MSTNVDRTDFSELFIFGKDSILSTKFQFDKMMQLNQDSLIPT